MKDIEVISWFPISCRERLPVIGLVLHDSTANGITIDEINLFTIISSDKINFRGKNNKKRNTIGYSQKNDFRNDALAF